MFSVIDLFKHFQSTCLRRFIPGLMLVMTLAACSSAPSSSPTSNSGGRYSIAQDRAPSGQVHLGSIPEVIPEPVARTQAGNRSPYTVHRKTYTVLPTEKGYSETGIASWYGEKFHGHKTSNGEVFDMYQASAAHKSLPIPSFLRVTNLDNNRSLIVENDRGPFHGDRIIDLSYAAALETRICRPRDGKGPARCDCCQSRGSGGDVFKQSAGFARAGCQRSVGGRRYLQVGAFSEMHSAQRVSDQLRQLTRHPVFIRSVNR